MAPYMADMERWESEKTRIFKSVTCLFVLHILG